MNKARIIKNIVIATLIGNVVLTIIKLYFGYTGNSSSLVTDGYNSMSDFLVSILLLITIKIAAKKEDENHPYGHQKYEGIAYLFLSFIIVATAGLLLLEGSKNLYSYIIDPQQSTTKPNIYTIFAALAALLIKVVLLIITRIGAKKYGSSSLKADSFNHLLDSLATLISLGAILLATTGLYYIEYIATIIIGLFILYNGIIMIKEGVTFLVDQAPDKKTCKEIKQTIVNVKGVVAVDILKIRMHMDHYYVDVEIAVDKNLSLLEAHDIAEQVHDKIELEYNVIHCMVHVNPADKIKR